MAYRLLDAIGRLWPSGTGLARVQGETRRLELLKIGAVNVRDTRRAPFLLSSAHPCVRDGSGSWQPGWTPEKPQGGVPGMGVNHAVELCGTRC